MTSIAAPLQHDEDDPFIDVRGATRGAPFLKCDLLNFAGSVNLKAAIGVESAKGRDRLLDECSILVKPSSGNPGVALAMVAASKRHRFLCVTAPPDRPPEWVRVVGAPYPEPATGHPTIDRALPPGRGAEAAATRAGAEILIRPRRPRTLAVAARRSRGIDDHS